MTTGYLRITVADHKANEFRTVGGAGFLTMAETRRRFREVPSEADSNPEVDDYTLILDLLDRNSDILDDKIISKATAETLLGEPVILQEQTP